MVGYGGIELSLRLSMVSGYWLSWGSSKNAISFIWSVTLYHSEGGGREVPKSSNSKLRNEKTRVGFGRTELSLIQSSHGHGPQNPYFQGFANSGFSCICFNPFANKY